MHILARFAATLVAVALLSPAAPARADVVLTWNEIAVRTLNEHKLGPVDQSRAAAIVQLAVFEAVNAISGEYEPYIGVAARPGASADAAAVTAAYRALKTFFSTDMNLDAAYAASLGAIADDQSKTDGIATGEAAATAILVNRQNDGSTPPMVSPIGPPEPGVYQLTLPPGCPATATGGAFYQWQFVRPFGVPDVTAFRPELPPSLTSEEFTKAYDEVKRVGAAGSTDRPQDRSEVALFYQASSPTLIFNMAARQVAQAEHTTISENARALALVNMAAADSLVASFAAKYYYNFWRPETAIRFTGFYGNTKIVPDPAYVPFVSTPCFPSYPSNHASASNGAAEVLRRIYGEGGHAITLTNPFNPAVANLQLTYSTFNEICDDVDDARIYGGIHYRFDQVAGNSLGREVGTYIYKHNLRKVNGSELAARRIDQERGVSRILTIGSDEGVLTDRFCRFVGFCRTVAADREPGFRQNLPSEPLVRTRCQNLFQHLVVVGRHCSEIEHDDVVLDSRDDGWVQRA